MTAQTAEIRATAPETLPQFLTLLVKGILRRLPIKLLIAGAIALLAWILHTYLLVVTNEGFNAGNSFWLDRILALQGRAFTGTLVWTLAAGLITSTVARILTYGFSRTVRSVVDTPRSIWEWAVEAGIIAIPLLIVGYFSAIFLGFFIDNSLLIAQLWLITLGILVGRHTSILLTILRLAWGDAQRAARRDDPIPFKLAWPGMYFVGVLIGLLAILPSGRILPIVCGCLGFLLVLLISAGLFIRSQGGTEHVIGKKVFFLILPPALLLLFTAAAPAFADDGGWLESGGTFSGWISSPGAGRAVLMGFLPAAGSGLGVLLGTALGSMVSIIGTAGIPTAVSSIKSTAVTAAPPAASPTGSTPPPPSRTAGHQVEGFQSPEAAESAGLSSRHRPGDIPQTTEAVSERGVGLGSERAGQEMGDDYGRTGQGAVETGTGRRDLRGVDPQSTPDTGTGSGSAAEAAGDAAGFEGESPAGQMSAERHRPEAAETPDGPLSDRHRSGGLEEQAGEPPPAAVEQSGMKAERHTPDVEGGPTAGRHESGGLAEADSEPAGLEQSSMKAERHTPEVEGGPTASRHSPEAESGPTAARHDPETAEGGGEMRARRASEEGGGPSAERFTAAETFEGPAPLHERHLPNAQPEIPIPPIPVPAYALDWELAVVRTTEDSGVEVRQTFELGERTRIGRHGAIDLKLMDPKVSRQHADILIEGSTCRIIDLNSSNGTFVNGRRITEPAELKHGDAVKIGDTYFLVQQKAE